MGITGSKRDVKSTRLPLCLQLLTISSGCHPGGLKQIASLFIKPGAFMKSLIDLYAALSLLALLAHKYGKFMADTQNIHNENQSEVKLRTTT